MFHSNFHFLFIQFFVLSLGGWSGVFSRFHYYISLRSSIIFCYLSRDIYLSVGISFSLSTVSEVSCGEFLEAFLISFAILLLIKSPFGTVVFWIALFETVVCTWSRGYWRLANILGLYLLFKILLIFWPGFLSIFLAKDKDAKGKIFISSL